MARDRPTPTGTPPWGPGPPPDDARRATRPLSRGSFRPAEPWSRARTPTAPHQRPRLHELLPLLVASLLTGGLIGIVGSAFRYLLVRADELREALVRDAHGWSVAGFVATVAAVALAAAVARWLVVRFAPLAAGSGVQHVEAVMRGQAQPGPEVIPVKFFGGLLAIGSGLALGREGPTVQMGAAIGTTWVRRFLPDSPDRTIMNAAGAGAGLAVAFNAPIGASIFVFEELTQSFTPRLVLATIGSRRGGGRRAARPARRHHGLPGRRARAPALWHLPAVLRAGVCARSGGRRPTTP